jgi:predicted RNA-binding Zn-ribbon protein involved in translation (DUF1610 family)
LQVVKRSPRNDVVTVKVGAFVAQCPECGETRFSRRSGAGNGGRNTQTVYSCVSCQAKLARGDLLDQIADEATRRAGAASKLSKRTKLKRRTR